MNNDYRYEFSIAILNKLLLKKLITEEEYVRIDEKNKKSFITASL